MCDCGVLFIGGWLCGSLVWEEERRKKKEEKKLKLLMLLMYYISFEGLVFMVCQSVDWGDFVSC